MPLKGIKVLELAGIAPGPFCGMILNEFGASIIKVDKVLLIYDFFSIVNFKFNFQINICFL